MNGSGFGYLFKQGVVNTWLNKMMSAASIGILVACLIIVGGSGLLAVNIKDIFVEIESKNEVVVFIKDDATDAEVDSLGQFIQKLEHVTNVEFVSKAEALEEQKEYMGEQGYLLDGLEEDNPLPASFRLTLDGLDSMSDVLSKLQGKIAIESISAPTDLADTLSGIEKTLLVVGSIVIGILVVASCVVISNTIRLTLFARRREISIMKYVGATNSFIRIPFVVEGITIGVVSALIAFGIISSIYSGMGSLLSNSSIKWLSGLNTSIIDYSELWYWVLGSFLVFGIAIGSTGSSSSIRRYLQV